MVFLSDGVDYFFNLTEIPLLQRVSSQCFPVEIIADNLLENLEIFELTLSSTDSDVFVTESMSSTTISILNDDGKDSLSLTLSLSHSPPPLSLSHSPLFPLSPFSLAFISIAVVMVSFQDVTYSGAEGSSVNVCVIANPADREFTVTLSTIQDTASVG